MPIRRNCDPINIIRIWDAIRSSYVVNQKCDMPRILKFLQENEECTQTQVELYIKQSLKDGLILNTKKGSASESSDCDYKITEQEWPKFDGKDWYCFECHLAGEVIFCKNCFRVFHADCVLPAKKKFDVHKNRSTVSDVETTYTFNEKLCSMCNLKFIDSCKLEKPEMNYLLKYVLHRIRTWLPDTITHTMAEEDRPTWLTDSELTWRANQLFFEHRDMSVIEVNLNNEHYASLTEFVADVMTVQHNVAIFHGLESQEYQATEFMVRDTFHDITELQICSDCYKHSNEKINLKWFTLPCRNPHELVWAKQKGYPYWPSKVIKKTSNQVDVRFFGGKHERALIPVSSVKPISVSKESLKIKSSLSFTKALEELIFHQKLLADPRELEKLQAESKPKKVTRKTIAAEVASPPSLTKTGKKRGVSLPSTRSKAPDEGAESDGTESDGPSASKRKPSMAELPAEPSCSSKPSVIRTPKIEPDPIIEPDKTSSIHDVSGNVISISDCEEEETGYSFRGNNGPMQPLCFDENNYEQVSSSTEQFKNDKQEAGLHKLDHPYSDPVEMMRRKLEALQDKEEMIKCAMDCMQNEMDQITEDKNEHMRRVFELHNAQISETKKKQWCYHCEQDAIYHCCWNTSYCSQTCQQQHWQEEHKKVCRRKRQA